MKKTALPIFVVFSLCALAVLFSITGGQPQKGVRENSLPQNTTVADPVQYVTASDVPQPAATDAASPVATADTVPAMSAASYAQAVQALSGDELDAVCEQYSAVGVQCAVIENGFVTGSYTYGYADRANGRRVTQDTKYRIASLSKLVTDMVFMTLADRGLVSLDADISDYYGFTVRNPYYSDIAITPRMLMTHTASVIDGYMFERSIATYSDYSIRDVVLDSSIFASYAPGAHHTYSNCSAALVGSVSELASGKCFETLAHENLFDPMHLDCGYLATSIENKEEIGMLYGGSLTLAEQLLAQFDPTLGQTVHLVQGNLTISAVDYAQLLCVLMNGGVYADGTRLLSQQSVDEMLSVQFDASGYAVGLGSFIYKDAAVSGRTLFCHTGSSYGMYACYAMDPVTKDGVVVLTSGADYAIDSTTEIYKICLHLIRLLLPA